MRLLYPSLERGILCQLSSTTLVPIFQSNVSSSPFVPLRHRHGVSKSQFKSDAVDICAHTPRLFTANRARCRRGDRNSFATIEGYFLFWVSARDRPHWVVPDSTTIFLKLYTNGDTISPLQTDIPSNQDLILKCCYKISVKLKNLIFSIL